MNRNDFAIIIDANLDVWVAQGNPAYEKLEEVAATPFVAEESGLFYSQMRHRVAMRHDSFPNEGAVIAYPSSVGRRKNETVVDCFPRRRRCTGTPWHVGNLRAK